MALPVNKTTSLVKNSAAAPVVYFDGVPTCGALNGVIELELTTRVLSPKSDGQVQCDLVAIAHLRSNITAAINLRDMIDKAIAIANGNSEVQH